MGAAAIFCSKVSSKPVSAAIHAAIRIPDSLLWASDNIRKGCTLLLHVRDRAEAIIEHGVTKLIIPIHKLVIIKQRRC